jgi:hypothetical protein
MEITVEQHEIDRLRKRQSFQLPRLEIGGEGRCQAVQTVNCVVTDPARSGG